jgi:hypothetical protein
VIVSGSVAVRRCPFCCGGTDGGQVAFAGIVLAVGGEDDTGTKVWRAGTFSFP